MESYDRTVSKKEPDRKRKYKACLFPKFFIPRNELIENIDIVLKKTLDVDAIINSFLFLSVQNKLIEKNVRPFPKYIKTFVKDITSDEIEKIIKDSFGSYQYVNITRDHLQTELNKKLNKRIGKKISKARKKSYLSIIKISIAEDISDSEAVKKYNKKYKSTINYSTFNYFKNKHKQEYSNIFNGIINELGDEDLLLRFP